MVLARWHAQTRACILYNEDDNKRRKKITAYLFALTSKYKVQFLAVGLWAGQGAVASPGTTLVARDKTLVLGGMEQSHRFVSTTSRRKTSRR